MRQKQRHQHTPTDLKSPIDIFRPPKDSTIVRMHPMGDSEVVAAIRIAANRRAVVSFGRLGDKVIQLCQRAAGSRIHLRAHCEAVSAQLTAGKKPSGSKSAEWPATAVY